jgi:SAM-dependent methyltransferase
MSGISIGLKKAYRRFREEWSAIGRLTLHTPALGVPSNDYDAYWHDRLADGPGELNGFQRFRADWTAERVERGARVLDVGCGDGGILERLRALKAVVPVGADVSPFVLAFLEKRGIEPVRLDLHAAGISSLPPADHILLFEVLEHLPNPETVLRDALSHAGKSVFFSVPNTGYFPYRLRLLFGRVPMQWRVHPGEHLRFWTMADMRWWLHAQGLAGRSELVAYRGIPLLNRIWPGLFGMGLLCEVRRDSMNPPNGNAL